MTAPRGGRARGRRPRYRGPDAPVPGGAADATPDADPASVARTIVLRQLTMAPRSRAQLAQKLADRGTPTDVADQVLDRMERVGLVDDVAFAQAWVRSRAQARGLSRRALGYELRDKGIDDETARAALGQVDDEAELATARELVARRLTTMHGLARDKQVGRLVGMLARKGYAGGVAFRIVHDALAAGDRDDVTSPEPVDD